jgi:hypothetical protein
MPQRLLDVRITGWDQDEMRRWKSRRSPLLIFAIFFVFIWLAPSLIPASDVERGGVTIRGNRVLLIQDDSGSMKKQQAIVDQRLAELREAHKYSEIACQLGDDEFPEFVGCVERLAKEQDIDGIYVFADFNWTWSEDGLRRVVEALGRTGIHVYLETIGPDPAPELMQLAKQSDGGLIRTH